MSQGCSGESSVWHREQNFLAAQRHQPALLQKGHLCKKKKQHSVLCLTQQSLGQSIFDTSVLVGLKEKRKNTKTLPPKKKQQQHKTNLRLSCILKVNGQGRKKTFLPNQGAFTIVRGKISPRPLGELKEQSCSRQPQPRSQGDLQWEEEDMTNFMLHEK